LWHPDGKRIIYTSNRGGAFQVTVAYVDGGKLGQVTVGGADHVVTDISADGTRLLDVSSRAEAAIFGMEVNTGRESELTSGSGLKLWPEVSPDGETIVFQSANMMTRLVTSSVIATKPVTNEGALRPIAASGFSPSWSPDGGRIAFLRFVDGKFDVFTVDATGQGERRLTTGGVVIKGYNQLPTTKFGRSICWSPDGDKIVYSARRSGVTNIWAAPIDGSASVQLSVNNDPNLFIYEPVCGDNNRVAFAAETKHAASSTWSLWVADNSNTKLVYEAKSLLRPIGWSDRGELIAGSDEKRDQVSFQGYPTTVKVIRVSIDGSSQPLAVLESTYFWMIELAPDSRTIAFVSDKDRADNIWLSDTSGAAPRRLTFNADPKIYFPSLHWSAEGKRIYYGKQSGIGMITMIDNFE
jgi:Tol biopolymer transport system component